VIGATSALELGIDVGDLDWVIQVDAPPTVSSFLQRMGRTGRRPGTTRNCLFLATSDPGLLRAAGLIELWPSGFVEPAVLHGRHELGAMDESTFLVRRDDGAPVLLVAGRAWRVTHLDWRRRRAFVEPAEDEGRSRWRGQGQFLGAAAALAGAGRLAPE